MWLNTDNIDVKVSESKECVNPGYGWRIKRNLDSDWDRAVTGFQTVFTDPHNPKFPTLVVDGLRNLTVYSNYQYEVSQCTFFEINTHLKKY